MDDDLDVVDNPMAGTAARCVIAFMLVLAMACSVALGGVFIAACIFAVRWLLGV